MLGTSLISANIGGVINKNGARTLILYTPEMSKKRRADFEKIKEEKEKANEEKKAEVPAEEPKAKKTTGKKAEKQEK